MSWRESPTALVATREIREATRTKSFRITLRAERRRRWRW